MRMHVERLRVALDSSLERSFGWMTCFAAFDDFWLVHRFGQIPPVGKDVFWNATTVQLPYTSAADMTRTMNVDNRGSASHAEYGLCGELNWKNAHLLFSEYPLAKEASYLWTTIPGVLFQQTC